nr:ribosomal protein S1 [Coleochaete scutata]
MGEPDFILPKILSLKVLKLEAWFALWKKWHSQQNIVRGFILNKVNGGYAVAIGRHVAFLPKSLRLKPEEQVGKYRLFRILNMRSDIRNIVVKEITDQYSSKKNKIEPYFAKRETMLTHLVSTFGRNKSFFFKKKSQNSLRPLASPFGPSDHKQKNTPVLRAGPFGPAPLRSLPS